MQNKRIIIGGGGTGGHIFPAIAIANAIRDNYPGTEILFVGAENKIEMEKVPEAGYKIIGLPVTGLQRRLTVKNISFFFKLWKSMRLSAKIIRDFKPDIAVGVGGYASGPILRAASAKGIPIVIQEQNSYAGLTNKLLSSKASAIFVAYYGMHKYFPSEKIFITGNPVRKDIIDAVATPEEAYAFFELDSQKKTILVIGGSLGARTINESVLTHLDDFGKDIQLLWQTGNIYYEKVIKETEGKRGENIKVYPFIKEMNLAFKVADVIISRAGAGTISELALVGKPVILVPSPNVAEDHQTKNALALSGKIAAIHVKDPEAREKLVNTAINLLSNEKLKKELSENLKQMALPGSAEKIAKEIFKIIC